MSEEWMNFNTAEGVVVGLVTVPTTIPSWFSKRAEEIRASSRRELETDSEVMELVGARDYVDELCSQNRPIPVRYPLSPQSQEEFVLIPRNEIENFQAAWKEAVDERKNPQVVFSDQNLRDHFGVIFMDDKREPEDMKRVEQVSRRTVQPWLEKQGALRQFILHVPMIDEEREDGNSYRIHTGMLYGSTVANTSHNWDKIVGNAYPDRVTVPRETAIVQ